MDYLWHKMMDAGVGQGSKSGSLTGAISGIETALWDLAGKIINMLCHNMCSPVGTIASGYACAAIRSFVALESDSVELKHWPDIIRNDGPIYKDGYLELPNKPGLGIELNEEVCRRHLSPGSGFFE